MDIGSATNILTESHTYLAKARSCGLTQMLIHKATQTGKWWDETKGIFRFKLCNANFYTYTSWFMEIQQKDNETLAACIHCFKTAARWCAFDNDTVAIHIFVQDLRQAPNITAKIYEKDPQTLAEGIRLVEKISAAHQLTATLTPSTVSNVSSDGRCFVCGQTGHFGHHCPDAQCYGWDEFGHFAQDCPHKIPPSGMPCHHGRSYSRHQYTHNWRDRSHSYYGPRYRRHFSRSQPHPHSHHDCSSSCKGTPHDPLPATAAVNAALQPMDAPITPHAMIPTGIVTHHPTLATSPRGTTHATPQTGTSLTLALPTAQHKKSPENQAIPKAINPP